MVNRNKTIHQQQLLQIGIRLQMRPRTDCKYIFFLGSWRDSLRRERGAVCGDAAMDPTNQRTSKRQLPYICFRI